MGHYNSEMESESEFRARVDPVNRAIKIRKDLEGIPFSAFMVSDFPALFRINNLSIESYYKPRDEDMSLIEKRIKEWKEKNTKSARKKRPR